MWAVRRGPTAPIPAFNRVTQEPLCHPAPPRGSFLVSPLQDGHTLQESRGKRQTFLAGNTKALCGGGTRPDFFMPARILSKPLGLFEVAEERGLGNVILLHQCFDRCPALALSPELGCLSGRELVLPWRGACAGWLGDQAMA